MSIFGTDIIIEFFHQFVSLINFVCSVRPCSHHVGGIWKRRFHSENASIFFPSTPEPEELENATETCHLGFLLDENSGREITLLSCWHRLGKVPLSNFLLSALEHKASVFKFLRFEERFWKAPSSWRISVDGRPNRRKKAAFSWRISVDGRPNRRNKAVMWTEPQTKQKEWVG